MRIADLKYEISRIQRVIYSRKTFSNSINNKYHFDGFNVIDEELETFLEVFEAVKVVKFTTNTTKLF